MKISKQTRIKMSIAQKKRFANTIHPMKGKQWSKKTRNNMSLAQKNLFKNGYKHPMLGRKHSEKSKQKMSLSHKTLHKNGYKLSIKSINKIKNTWEEKYANGYVHPMKGKHLSKKSKQKMSLAKRNPHIFKDGIEYKECSKCKEIKLLGEFGKISKSWDKLKCVCKECENKNYKYIRKNSIQYKLTTNIRIRILDVLKGKSKKSAHTLELLGGYTWNDCKKYLESFFIDGMTWDDFLVGRIDIHHLNNCSWYDLTDPEQQKECFNITNLYPLWKNEHKQNYNLLHSKELKEEFIKERLVA